MTGHDSVVIPDWPAPAWVRAVSTTRLGGFSKAPFSSFNLALHVGDDSADVLRNRAALGELLTLPKEPFWLTQVHGKNVVDVAADGSTEADAAYAVEAGQICAVMTADCLPILFCHEEYPIVAAVHAGWRGLAAGVIEATLDALPSDALAAGRHKFMAWLGPAISIKSFEVGLDVYSVLAIDDASRQCFEPSRPQHWYADLYALARLRLLGAGVDAIYGGDFCTYSDSQRFYSHRRDGVSGRMASLIWMTL